MAGFKNSRPRPSFCPRCGRVCLAGWAEGVRIRVDLTPLSREQLPAAILCRVALFWLDPIGLAYLDRHRMRDAGRRYPVLPRHHCGIRWPSTPASQVSPQTDDAIPY